VINFRLLKLSDPMLWASVAGLITAGFLAILSATYRMQMRAGLDPFIFVKRHFAAFLVALVGLGLFSYFDYRHLKKMAPYFYVLALLLLVSILFSGAGAGGAQRWLQLGPFSFQPSEISKLALIVALAAFLSERKKIQNIWEIGYVLALVGFPFFLVFKQPDLGTALVFLAILVGMLAASEASPGLLIIIVTPMVSILLRPLFYLWLVYLLALILALFLSRAKIWDWGLILGLNIGVGGALPFIWTMLKSYQRQRITAFLNPAADPYGAGYHALQSKIAIGSGWIFGKGFLQGSQTQLQFIPEQFSDFVFSVIGEEFGFVGSAIILGLFGLLIWRILAIASQARDPFGKMLASGVAVMIVSHVLANMGMAMGILPVVGIPLPFLSYGGSSLFMNFIAVGIVQSIAMRRQKLFF